MKMSIVFADIWSKIKVFVKQQFDLKIVLDEMSGDHPSSNNPARKTIICTMFHSNPTNNCSDIDVNLTVTHGALHSWGSSSEDHDSLYKTHGNTFNNC